ncbi:ATP-binding protein [Bradyrhizobium sp.]|uniref:ATP-binding protein n=1 Tax=Bradyrhizobium sp. TaxID=376 RepID=UPI003C4502A9
MSDAFGQAVDEPNEASRVHARESGLSSYLPMFAAATLMLLMVAAAGATIWNLHDRVEQDTKANLARLALVISDQTSRSFQSVDLVLREVVDRFASEDLDGDAMQAAMIGRQMHDYLAKRVGGIEQIDNLLLIGAAGDALNISKSWPFPAMSLTSREQFRQCRDNANAELFVSEPVRNKLDGAWTIYLARCLEDRHGHFAGVVDAAVRLKHFEDFYRSVALGEGGSISLIRRDGIRLVRYPQDEKLIGEPVSSGWSSANSAGGEPDRAAVWGRGVNGTTRYIAFNRVPGFPLLVSTALTRDAVLGSWRRAAMVLAMGASGAVTGILLLLFALARRIRRMRHSESLLARKNAELARSRGLLLDAERIGRLGYWESKGDQVIWSPQLFEIAGVPPSETASVELFMSLIHPDDVADYVRTRNRARAEQTQLIHEHRWVRPDGSVRWIRLEADPRLDDDGRLVGFFGIAQDITERKEAEIEAEETQNRLLDAIESMPQGFVLYDRDDRFVLANTHFREMFPEMDRLMKPGMPYDDVIRCAYSVGLLELDDLTLDDWIKRNRVWRYAGSKPRECLYADGRWIQFIDHKTSDGGTASLRTDITKFKKVEAALEQRLADLEKVRNDLELQKQELVATTDKLIVARDTAEAASRAKSDFLAIMSHEVRTPMTGMVGMIDLLADTELSEQQQRYTAMAKESADGLLSVINDILDFSKLEAGRLLPEAIDFDIAHLVRGVETVMRKKIEDKGLAFEVVSAPDLPQWLNGDPSRIRQILLNLVNNAVKFTEHGSVRIDVSHRALSDGRKQLSIAVLDSGVGIAPDVQQQLFKPFMQADTSISRKYGGSGLGLAICKQLCAMMGGSIEIDSEIGRGSTFRFSVTCSAGLPRIGEEQVPLAPSFNSLKILVAEDSPIIASLIKGLLRRQGFEPVMVVNGREAVLAVQRAAYDLVLMDVQMPEMDGISATKAIRKLAGPERTVPIIALTANAMVGQRETYLAAGMNDYVTKPIQPSLLFTAIKRWAEVATAAAAQRATLAEPRAAG